MNWNQYKPKQFVYRGKYIDNWFSNMSPTPILIDGKEWPSVENYYQAMKTLNLNEREKIRKASPSESKYLGRRVTLRRDWENVKVSIMKQAVTLKFEQHPDLLQKLLATKGPIIEWNNWNDRIWGVTLDGIGKNLLGNILTDIRDSHK